MKELSIFIDESGDFGELKENPLLTISKVPVRSFLINKKYHLFTGGIGN